MSLLIYQAVSNGYDKPAPPKDVASCEHVDYQIIAGKVEAHRAAAWNRYHKIAAFPNWRPLSLYLDGNIGLAKPACEVNAAVYKFLASSDMAVCRHADRRCAYVEIEACLGRGKITKKQAEMAHDRLHEIGLPRNFGLWECGILMRRSCVPWLEELHKLWFEFCLLVPRDQIWLPAALYMLRDRVQTGRFNTLEMNVRKNSFFTFRAHR
jgi:hypothetical protein